MATRTDGGRLRALAEDVVRRLRSDGHEALFAGGSVRDLLLGKTPKDYDVATSARPEQVRALFPRTVAVGEAFGVVQVIAGRGLTIEVATFRADAGYTDGRRPDAVRFTDAREDALRRDFTINGMFLDPIDDKVLDFVGGQEDLSKRILRAIGDPHQRFDEDKLRLMRAVRFAAQLGFTIASETADAIRLHARTLSVVSSERILMELRALLGGPWRADGLRLLCESTLAPNVFEELAVALAVPQLVETAVARLALFPADASVSLAVASLFDALMDEDAEAGAEMFFRRLKGSNDERELTVWLLKHSEDLRGVQARRLSYRKRLYAEPNWPWLLEFSKVRGLNAEAEWCAREASSLSNEEISPPPLLTGDDLTKAGFRPGPAFKDWLERVRDLQLDGAIASKEEALSRVQEWSASSTP